MKKQFLLLAFLSLIIASCNSDDTEDQIETPYFLNEIRPVFFDHLNFNSASQIDEIPGFLENFRDRYGELETEYEAGIFTSESDLDNMRLAGMYYSFGLTAIVRAYLDSFITFEDIIGNYQIGPYSGLPVSDPNFQNEELKAMMLRSKTVAYFAMYVNGFNDKTYATYMVSKQISGRVADIENHYNNPQTQDSMIDYVDSRIYDYDLFQDWNVLMSQLSFTNYKDSLNTFTNSRMNTVLHNLNTRLVIGAIPDLNGRFAEILGPIFRADLNMKKLDWIFSKYQPMTQEGLDEIDSYIETIDALSTYVENDKSFLLNLWDYKETIDQRVMRLNTIKQYRSQMEIGKVPGEKPDLRSWFLSKDYLQAYQCYNCHKSVY